MGTICRGKCVSILLSRVSIKKVDHNTDLEIIQNDTDSMKPTDTGFPTNRIIIIYNTCMRG